MNKKEKNKLLENAEYKLKEKWTKLPLRTKEDMNQCFSWFSELNSVNSPLLNFNNNEDKWQTLQGWIGQWQRLDTEIISKNSK